MRLKQIFGVLFTLLGALILLFSVYSFLKGTASILQVEVSGFQTFVVAILGLIFFTSGVKFLR